MSATSTGRLNVAFGFEYRDETFKITNGEPNSFYIDREYQLAEQGFGSGSNGFPGFQPGDAGKNKSSSIGAYIDLESNVTERLLVGAALRYEDYEEFGDTLDGKVGHARPGRRGVRPARRREHRLSGAPQLARQNLRNVTTEFNMGPVGGYRPHYRPTNPVAQQKGRQGR